MTEKTSLEHLAWLIESRGKTNEVALKLLGLFETYGKIIQKSPHSPKAQALVSIAFSLWRAAFLTETKGKTRLKAGHAENFLRKMLADNAITFSQDMLSKEWSVVYYTGVARFHLDQLAKVWPQISVYDLSEKNNSKGRWTLLQEAFETAVKSFENDLARDKRN